MRAVARSLSHCAAQPAASSTRGAVTRSLSRFSTEGGGSHSPTTAPNQPTTQNQPATTFASHNVAGAPYTNSVSLQPSSGGKGSGGVGSGTADQYTLSLSIPPEALLYGGAGSAAGGPSSSSSSSSSPSSSSSSSSITVFAKDKLDYIAGEVASALGAKKVRWVVNGRRLQPGASVSAGGGGGGGDGGGVGDTLSEPASLNSILGACADLEVDGVRFSINEGAALTRQMGKASKRGLATTYAFVTAGGALTLAACVAFWKAVVPKDQQRRYE